MLSKNKIKYLHSLNTKKSRDVEGVFVAEGPKVVGDIFARYPSNLTLLVATSEWLNGDGKKVSASANCEIVEVTTEELAKASFLCHPQQVLGVFKKLKTPVNTTMLTSKLTIALDGVQDPGNLGTIVRMAEGAGVTGIIMSSNTVDIYNPKTIRSTMGSLYRVPVIYVDDICEVADVCKSKGVTVYAAHLKGTDNYNKKDYTKPTAFMIGNEGNGLTDKLADKADEYVRIPMQGEVESLNAAVACTILTYEAVRQRL